MVRRSYAVSDPVPGAAVAPGLLSRVLARLESAGSSPERAILSAAEPLAEHLGAIRVNLYLVAPTGQQLEHSGTWESRGRLVRLSDRTDPLRFGWDEGLPGRVWASGRPGGVGEVRMTDGESRRPGDPSVPSAVAFPLVARGSVLGVLEFWLASPWGRGRSDRELLDVALELLGTTLGRLRTDEVWADVPERSFAAVLARRNGARVGLPSRSRARERSVAEILDEFPIAFANAAFARLTGYHQAELPGMSLRPLMNVTSDAAAEVARALEMEQRVATQIVLTPRNGTSVPLRLDLAPVAWGAGSAPYFFLLPPDPTEGAGTSVVQRGEVDPLTRLANRTYLSNTLRRAFERAERSRDYRFAVLFIDLDGFKGVNDRFGHLIGDQLLVAVARQLEGAVRPGDLVARYGGDEFVVVVEAVASMQPVLAVVERIADRMSRPISVEGKELRVSASIGIALSDHEHRSAEDLLSEADAAMYLAKQAGGGRYRIFDLDLQERAVATQRTRGALKNSLERGEMRLHYQPMVELGTEGITGMEALLRWHHPERGILPAGEFIADAEDMGLILPIGRWVIHEACRQIRAWCDELPPGTPLVLSVNLSTRELLDPDLAEGLRLSLQDTGADPRSLRFEIPESFFARPSDEATAALQPLLDLGVRISIGDFGSGYASLAHLHRLPVDCLKIDRHFVADLSEPREEDSGGTNRAVRSILALAESLGIPVVASGVETSRQKELLEQFACHFAQGNLFSKPLDQVKAAHLLRRAWGASGTA